VPTNRPLLASPLRFSLLRAFLLSICGMSILSGCGHDGPTLVPIEGTITYGGKPWPHKGVVVFHPVEVAAGQPRLMGCADFQHDGRFVVTSFKPGDGLAPGRYKVTVDSWEEWPLDAFPGKNCHVPEAYRAVDTTPLEVSVPGDLRSHPVTLDVPPR